MDIRDTFRSATTVLWDWNGTLLDDPRLCLDVLNETIVEYGCEAISFERFREIYQHPLTNMYEALGFDLEKTPFLQLSKDWHERYVPRSMTAPLYECAIPLLERFQLLGKKQHILSALPQHLLEAAVAERKIGGYFGSVRGSQKAGELEKGAGGRALLHELGVESNTVVLIGDSSHDAEVAKELGIGCLLHSDGLESAARLRKHGLPVLERLSELMNFLEGR